jgi:hypothetical protein
MCVVHLNDGSFRRLGIQKDRLPILLDFEKGDWAICLFQIDKSAKLAGDVL